MDVKSERFWRVKVAGVAETFTLSGSIKEAFPRIIKWLVGQRSGDFTIECCRSASALGESLVESSAMFMEVDTPEPAEGETYESYYTRLLVHFEGGEAMARFIANDYFDEPQLPWLGDERVARFIHMNASDRLASKADPAEYATLRDYVSRQFPDLFATLTLRG